VASLGSRWCLPVTPVTYQAGDSFQKRGEIMTHSLDEGLDVLRTILRHTSADPIKGEQIQALTGVPAREVADLVSHYTKRGFMICSGGRGYYQGTRQEFEAHLAKERDRAVEVLRKVSGGKKNMINELSLFEQPVAA
jgi:hypothetical protein